MLYYLNIFIVIAVFYSVINLASILVPKILDVTFSYINNTMVFVYGNEKKQKIKSSCS